MQFESDKRDSLKKSNQLSKKEDPEKKKEKKKENTSTRHVSIHAQSAEKTRGNCSKSKKT